MRLAPRTAPRSARRQPPHERARALVQPVLSIIWAALLLREELAWPTVLGGVAVIVCAGIAVRVRLDRDPSEAPTPR